MRPPRFFASSRSSVIHAHLISRALDRNMIFDAAAKEKFREILARQCAFSQIELVTFCLMGNHFHLLLRIAHDAPNPLDGSWGQAFPALIIKRCSALVDFLEIRNGRDAERSRLGEPDPSRFLPVPNPESRVRPVGARPLLGLDLPPDSATLRSMSRAQIEQAGSTPEHHRHELIVSQKFRRHLAGLKIRGFAYVPVILED